MTDEKNIDDESVGKIKKILREIDLKTDMIMSWYFTGLEFFIHKKKLPVPKCFYGDEDLWKVRNKEFIPDES